MPALPKDIGILQSKTRQPHWVTLNRILSLILIIGFQSIFYTRTRNLNAPATQFHCMPALRMCVYRPPQGQGAYIHMPMLMTGTVAGVIIGVWKVFRTCVSV